jgi:hypothetical protein
MVEKYKDDLTIHISAKLETLETESSINKFLSDNNLPYCIESSDGGNNIPESLFNKISQVQTKGGTEFILNQVENLNKKNLEISDRLREILKKINKEEDEDNNLRKEHGNKWMRPPSNVTNMSFKQSIIDYTAKLDVAAKCDEKTKNLIQENAKYFELISLDKEKLIEKIPVKSETTNLSGTETAKAIKDLLNEIDPKKNKILKIIESLFNNLNSGDVNNSFIKVLQNKNTEQSILNEKKSEYDVKLKEAEDLSNEIKEIQKLISEKMIDFNKQKENVSKLGEKNEEVFLYFIFFNFFLIYFSSLKILMDMLIIIYKS